MRAESAVSTFWQDSLRRYRIVQSCPGESYGDGLCRHRDERFDELVSGPKLLPQFVATALLARISGKLQTHDRTTTRHCHFSGLF